MKKHALSHSRYTSTNTPVSVPGFGSAPFPAPDPEQLARLNPAQKQQYFAKYRAAYAQWQLARQAQEQAQAQPEKGHGQTPGGNVKHGGTSPGGAQQQQQHHTPSTMQQQMLPSTPATPGSSSTQQQQQLLL